VNTPENWERYVLAIGEQEDFSLAAFPGLLHELYFVKTEFFQKTAWSIFEGKIGRGLLIVTLILIVSVILFVFWFFKKTKRI
ncbi:MAG: hypothetical protein NTY66_02945, partial [Candidatus Vogelbacteria bacterium]|nr:hypothetical protein [Candidatus Vogelbacteria bacterium]